LGDEIENKEERIKKLLDDIKYERGVIADLNRKKNNTIEKMEKLESKIYDESFLLKGVWFACQAVWFVTTKNPYSQGSSASAGALGCLEMPSRYSCVRGEL
jgi:hypothetical protein